MNKGIEYEEEEWSSEERVNKERKLNQPVFVREVQ